MQIEKQISPYIVFSEDNVLSALRKITENKRRIIFSIHENGKLEGVMTDGDFRNWLISEKNLDLNASVSTISNKKFISAFETDSHEDISRLFSEKIECVPLLDAYGRLTSIALSKKLAIRISQFSITDSPPAFVIAEIGINHNGSFDLAKKLIDLAVESGANCAKFQMRDLKSLYSNSGNPNDIREDLGSQYALDLLTKYQLSDSQMFKLFDYCRTCGIIPMCTPWDMISFGKLEEYNIDAYKIASADLTNHHLLTGISKTRKPILCSTGMSKENEIREAVEIFNNHGIPYALLHCNSTYPTPFKDVNLRYLSRLKEIGKCPIGYSGHERGYSVVLGAIAMGCTIVEKHFTIDRTMEGNDHRVSLLPDEFRTMVQKIREVEEALGNGTERIITQGELINRETLAKSIVANQHISMGELFTKSMFSIKSPGKGIQPNKLNELVGKHAIRNIRAGDFLFESDLLGEIHDSRDYSFNRPWGVPVRFHDYRELAELSNPDFLEFHLSYKDLEANIGSLFKKNSKLGVIVHSPDLFPGDHILDLASESEPYRKHSICEFQRVIAVTKEISKFFKHSAKTYIVASVGGFTKDSHLSKSKKSEGYKRLAESLNELSDPEIEILPQTLPPFPWYFGGQLFLNLFVELEDTLKFCQDYNFRLCLDTSHSKLACNFFGISFREYVKQLSPFAAHLHVVDAKGVDGEGLQIGQGEIDFKALADDLNQYCPHASFIPEIWQGHKNGGQGFWTALNKLEAWF